MAISGGFKKHLASDDPALRLIDPPSLKDRYLFPQSASFEHGLNR
jgi:hypothetical protein